MVGRQLFQVAQAARRRLYRELLVDLPVILIDGIHHPHGKQIVGLSVNKDYAVTGNALRAVDVEAFLEGIVDRLLRHSDRGIARGLAGRSRPRAVVVERGALGAQSADLPMLNVDAVLFEQALFNLLDNAAKYARAGTTIQVEAWRNAATVSLQIIDEGEGIPPAGLENIFDKFFRAQKGDHVRAGTGLGLAIARGFFEAMHGTITASNVLTFPRVSAT
jgi:signal transduction histidine kinase